MKITLFISALIVIFSLNCSFSNEILHVNDNVSLVKYPASLLDFDVIDYDNVLIAFTRSCDKFLSLEENANIFEQFSNNVFVSDVFDTYQVASNVKNKSKKYVEFFLKNYFTPYLIIDRSTGSEFGVFTGYYLPEINVRKVKDYRFKYPIYKRPNDLVKGVPYFTREEINNGVLKNKGLEIFYTDDIVDLFFLQIQGSGFVKDVDTGELIKLGFDGKNNQEYSSIGKILRGKGFLDSNNLNSVSIKNFLKNNLNVAEDLMNLNKSYVFFKIVGDDKIVGSQGVELTDYVSLAVDTRYIPLGLPLLLNTDLTFKNGKRGSLNKIMVSQDTGSAITGVIRGDIFFGSGELAEELASYQHARGQYFILIPKGIEGKLFDK